MFNSSNKFYFGVVESRADPLKLGRCKVRIMGIHTENTQVLPTKDLPWAIPLLPITSASVSGIGISPTGPVEGTWVVCIFRDEGSFQEPIMIGTLSGIPEEKELKLTDPYQGKSGTRYEGLKDITTIETDLEKGKSLNDSYSEISSEFNDFEENSLFRTDNVLKQVESSYSSKTVQKQQKVSYKLGEATNSLGLYTNAGTINDYKNSDNVQGACYGKYQFSSYMNSQGPTSRRAANSPVKQFLDNSDYKEEFAGLIPATPPFDKKWKEVAAREPQKFEEAQRQYYIDTNYAPALNDLRKKGIDLTERGPAVQEMVFVTLVHYKNTKPIERALADKNLSLMTDAEIIEAVQQDKLKHLDSDFDGNNDSKNNIRDRIFREKARLIDLASDESLFDKEDIEAIKKKHELVFGKSDPQNAKIIPSSGVIEPITIPNNNKPGFQDPFGVYPRKNWINEQDVSRLARNEKIEKTIQKAKERSLVKNVKTAGGVTWSEPKSPYGAIYPLNHVYQTESGHVVEYDDTPGAERIHIYHRAGSFIEFHPDGSVVYKNVKKQFEITILDRNIFVGGNCNITVGGDANIHTKGMMNIESEGDMTIRTGANLKIEAEGQAFVVSNGDLHLGSTSNINEGATNIFMNCTWKPKSVSAEKIAIEKITVEVFDDDEDVPLQSAQNEGLAIQKVMEDGFIPTPSNPQKEMPRKSSNGTMISSLTKPDPEMDTLKKVEPDKKKIICPGEDAVGSDFLSTNFKLADLTTSPLLTKVPLKAQLGLTKCEIFENLSQLAKNVLEPIRATYGNEFIITSAFREAKTNKKSQHPKGQAVDIQFPGLPKEMYVHRIEEISRILPDFDQMILEYHGINPVIHISYNKDGNRRQKKSTPDLKTYFAGFRDQYMGLVYS